MCVKLPDKIGSDYLDPEMWLGKNNPKYECLFYSHINHYFNRFPEEKYTAPPTGLFKEQISLSSDKPVGRRPTKLSSESSSRGTDHLDRV